MDITVLYFASLADEANLDQESLSVEPPITLSELYQQVAEKYSFSRPQSQLRVAVNDNFVDWSQPIQSDDQVAFIPPVAGG